MLVYLVQSIALGGSTVDVVGLLVGFRGSREITSWAPVFFFCIHTFVTAEVAGRFDVLHLYGNLSPRSSETKDIMRERTLKS